MGTAEGHWKVVSSFLRLPPGFEIDTTSAALIDITSPEFKQARTNINTPDVALKHLLRNGEQFIIAERYFQDNWLCWGLLKVPNYDSIGHDIPNYKEQSSTHYDVQTLDEWCELGIEDILPYWKEHRNKIPDGDMYEQLPLMMKPPSHGSSKGSIAYEYDSRPSSRQQEVDPNSYLQRKYYEMLYSLKVPLAHFVKSKLSRIRVMCKQHDRDYGSVLKSVLVDLTTFEERHNAEHCGLLKYDNISEESKSFRIASIKEEFGVNIESTRNPRDIMSDVSNILKVRDIKLQIMVLLEILAEGKLDASIKQYESSYGNQLSERSLNMVTTVTRFSRRRSKVQSVKPVKKPSQFEYCQNLDILLDKLGIAEALISTDISLHSEKLPNNKLIHEYKHGIVNKNKEMSSKGFLNYVVVPYWYNKLPLVVTFITNKVKGPTIENKPTNATQNTNPSRSRASSVSSTGDARSSSPQMTAISRARTNSNLVEFLEEETTKKNPALASRTSSDLKINRLQKRQMSVQDLSIDEVVKQRRHILEEFSTARTVLVNGKSISFSQTQNNSFQRVGKRKLESIVLEGGPAGPPKDIHVPETPAKMVGQKKETPVLVDSPSGSTVKKPVVDAPPVKLKTRHVRRRLFAP
ncbi:unnamed protein product [Kluyveromyces dobzhanskii CBS 2104]|uniref:WGS project CCBQ000000000 data, contig 00015 n=1 Tax=Kluyveromyces dobzhanskii CBS 2104 TaxID=1427455 RepID=A0A0A8L9S9_9SACH|nr:unnamed protein product [Kluyveromyces dobzhanskii CBS 2104]